MERQADGANEVVWKECLKAAVKEVCSKEPFLRGKTFMKHLESELELKHAGHGGCTGAHFWSKMESWFGDADEESEALDLASIEGDGTDIEGLPAFAAFSALMPPTYNREPMMTWAAVQSELNKASAIICANALRRLKPALGGDHYKTGVEVIKLFHRTKLLDTQPAIVDAVVNKLDLFLEQVCVRMVVPASKVVGSECVLLLSVPQTLKYYNQTGCDPVEFINENEALARMVFPKHLLDPIMELDNKDELKKVKAEISELYSNKRSGALLFSSAMKSLVVTEIDRIIREGCEELEKREITDESYQLALATATKSFNELPGMDLVSKRVVSIVYRGITLTTTVKSARVQAELAFMALTRSHAVRGEVLTALPGEGVVTTDTGGVQSVSKALMAKATRARRTFTQAVGTLRKGTEPTGGKEIKARECCQNRCHSPN
eukprot:2367982-Amphidinium_carterae.2